MSKTMWALSIAACIGALLNALKNPACFAIWTLTNTGWIAVKLRQRSWPEAMLWTVNLATSALGLATW